MKIIEITNVDFSLRHFLLPLMRAMRARGHEVVGGCAEGPLLDGVRAEGFRVIALPFVRRVSPLSHLRAFWRLVGILRAEKPDLVHAHMPISGFLARLAARVAGVPKVAYTCHGFLFNDRSAPRSRRVASFLMEWTAARFTDVFLTVSEAEAGDARRLGIARAAEPVRNGRNPAVFRPDPAARARIRAELGVAPETVVIIAVSRLVWHKGYPELAAAMHAVPDAELWVVGERLASDRGADMTALLRDAGLGGRLRLLGYRDDIPALLAAADIFTLPSRFEGLPMSVIEAMLTGLPVVATRVRGPDEQVIEGETGLKIAAGDAAGLGAALARLAGDPRLRAQMGNAGRLRALALYDETKVLERTLRLLGVPEISRPEAGKSPR
ncbi:MAG TPA: glycosyltransferase family 4 protein [Rhodopila sp.]|uniref:glycosyltransferase family 4 protein n=1 Tax=Rhodopila sp. TaxID=2480087 RepID=UPI002C29EF51|nr:glycosyltransferase family 4 protein [Rhodopila sp.]HVY17360.1 glycosyltransferase family 4 protein [Rhodopila sp.]